MIEKERRVKVERFLDEVWPAQAPPPGFAERVVDAPRQAQAEPSAPAAVRVGKRASPPALPRWPLLLAGVAAGATGALAAVLLLSFMGESPAGQGHLRAQERLTVNVAGRAKAVLEPGAEIAWSGHGRGVRVDQPRGAVFYRVDKGDAFEVVTPAGEIAVRGTCFRVTAGAASIDRESLATAATVEVMEGAVLLRNRTGELQLKAGERGLLALGLPPRREPLPALRVSPAPRMPPRGPESLATSPARGTDDDDGQPGRVNKYFDFTPEERRSLERRCLFMWALPRHLTHFAGTDFSQVPLGPDDRVRITAVLEQHRDQFVEQLRGIYLEVVGDRRTAERLSPMSLFQEVDGKSPRAEGVEARRLILREWEGSVLPPAEGELARRSPVERFWRILVGAQDDLVRRLEAVVSPAEARRIAEELLDIRMDGRENHCPSGAASRVRPGAF